MSIRTDYLTARLRKYLDRRTMPRGLEGKPDAQKAEITSLVAALGKYAPGEAYDDWWAKMEFALDEIAETRAWPQVSEIGKAAKRIGGTSERKAAETWQVDEVKLNAERMNEGQPVGESWLYGRLAVALERSGKVSRETMRKYRSDLYFSAKNVYGEEGARAMEADWIARHEAAEELDGPSRQRTVAIPDKRVEAAE